MIKSLRRFGKGLFSWTKGRQSSFHVDVDGRRLDKLCLRGMSKPGRLSWTAHMEGQPVKIYECCNEAHAQFIEDLSANHIVGGYFPRCLLRNGFYVIVEWVEGEAVTWKQAWRKPGMLGRVAQMQATFHAMKLGVSASQFGFDYMSFLTNRVERYKGALEIHGFLTRIREDLDTSGYLSEERLSHPDVTAANLVEQQGTGLLKIVDNELLGHNHYYLIDLFSTHKSFGRRMENVFFDRYIPCYVEQGGNLSALVNHERYFLALWSLRLVGSLLQGGQIEQAVELLRQYDGNRTEPNRLIQYAQQRYV